MKSIPEGFRLNGRPLVTDWIPVPSKRAMEFLDKSPDGELYTRFQLAGAIHCSATTVSSRAYTQHLEDYREMVTLGGRGTRQFLYGSKSTIAKLRKKLNENR